MLSVATSRGRALLIAAAGAAAVAAGAAVTIWNRTPPGPATRADASGRKDESAGGARFIQKLKAGERAVIVTMGTSLTYGRYRWVPEMKRWLRSSFPGKAKIFNEARPLAASTHEDPGRSGLRVLPRVTAHHPDVVFIEFAINDAYRPYGISVEQSKENLNAMIDQILASDPDTEIILQTMNCAIDVPGRRGKPGRKRPNLAAYYQGYRDVAEQRGLMLIDHYANWIKLLRTDPARFIRLVPDGLHPAREGSREVILPQLERSLLGKEGPTRGGGPLKAEPAGSAERGQMYHLSALHVVAP